MGFKKIQNSAQTRLRFYRKWQFAVKTDRNFIFLCHKIQILDRLHIMVWYICFYGFQKNSNFSSKFKGLAINLSKKHRFAAKTDWNSVFYGRKAQILDRLHIMVSFIGFYRFSKFSNFGSKCKWVSLQFYRKTPVYGRN
jgi:hypothetical protein